jgi:hypothetical protein
MPAAAAGDRAGEVQSLTLPLQVRPSRPPTPKR